MLCGTAVTGAAAFEDITFKPGKGPRGTIIKVDSGCPNVSLGKPLRAVVGLYHDDAFFWVSGYSTFHEVEIQGKKSKDFRAKIKVGPAHKYTPGTGAQPLPDVKRKPRRGDRLGVQVLCYYRQSAFPQYGSAEKTFRVTKG